MSQHLRNTACPKCRAVGHDRAGDNLGEYSDGHKVCWRCGYWEPPSTGARLRELQGKPPVEYKGVFLPHDVDPYIPYEPRLWLSKYDITDFMIVKHRIMWSEYRKMLVFPIFDERGSLLAWQGRNFGDDGRKYFTRGNVEEVFHLLQGTDRDWVIFTEDMVSAIKVNAAGYTSMPLFGTNVSTRLPRIKVVADKLCLWLDPDMRMKALKLLPRIRLYGMEGRMIVSDKDPKEYSLEEIREFVTNLDKD